MSRLSAFCDRVIEACWLAAIIMAPLFFNVYSSRTFEPDKIALVRSLALVMIACWAIIKAESLRGGASGRTSQGAGPLRASARDAAERLSRNNPLIFPTLALVLCYLISTIASVAPGISLLGSYTRMQGLYTTFSYIVIFLLTANRMRSREQLERAITVALLTSFPIAFFGIIQHYFLDPLPWGGDVNTRVASNMGNSIFVAAYLITVIPLAIGRLVGSAARLTGEFGGRSRLPLYGGIALSLLAFAAAWGLSFELGAKGLIESGFKGTLTPQMLSASDSNLTLALLVTFLVLLAWWLAGIFIAKKRAILFLLVGLYSFLLTIQGLTLFFTQSRGPLLGLLAGLLTFALVYAVARGMRRLALGTMGAAVLGLLVLVAFNAAADTSFAGLKNLPYIGRLGQVFQTDEGTGKVRVLIWQGAIKLVVPHAPLWSPTTGDDALNPIRPLIGYGPETIYLAYNPFYPPELGHIESRTATPDRSHNETFDALITTGLIGWLAENILFLSIFYFGFKWLGLVRSDRERNIFIALWYGGGLAAAVVLGLTLGWYFLGVALPAGMLLGLFIYLAGFVLTRSSPSAGTGDPARTLLIVVFLSAIVGHFIEIHFGIAIAATRTMFWFLAGLLVFVGTRGSVEAAATSSLPVAGQETERQPTDSRRPAAGPARKRRSRGTGEQRPASRQAAPPLAFISTTPLITLAFILGLILATMGYDYITTVTGIAGQGNGVSALGLIWNALTVKTTTGGPQASYAMLCLFVMTFLLALGIALGEWGWQARLPAQEWLVAAGLFGALAIAILAAFLVYHTILLGSAVAGVMDALLAAFALFVVFMLVMIAVIAVTLHMDEGPFATVVSRPTNWLVAPAALAVALVLLLSSNVSVVQADMVFKDASQLSNDNSTLPNSISMFQLALAMQPNQDYYLLFLGRAYLQYAQATTDDKTRSDSLTGGNAALTRARDLNPLNPDHSANMARLNQAWASLLTDPKQQEAHYQNSFDYYQQSIRLSPYTTHLYDQYGVSLLDYSDLLNGQHQSAAATEARAKTQQTLDRSSAIDSSFCLTYGIQSQLDDDWRKAVADGFRAFDLSNACDVFGQEGRSAAMQGLGRAGDRAKANNEGGEFTSLLEQRAKSSPSIELYTVLLNYYSKAGQIDDALRTTDAAIALIGSSDSATLKQYQDFRGQLVSLQQLIAAADSNPNDAEAQRKLADYWLARSQPDQALPRYEQVAKLLPNDYSAHEHVTLLLVRQNQLTQAGGTISATMALSPDSDRSAWEQLAQALDAAQRGDKSGALAIVQALIKSTDPKNTLMLDSFKALADKLQASS